jgi:diguanylate cyclase (GGDEF)-like protein/PAS domain S-box-containing protein
LAYIVWMATLAVVYYLLPAWHIAVWGAIGLSSTAAICVGVAKNRPRRRTPWWLMSAASLAFTAGIVTALVLSEVLKRTAFPSLADVFYLAAFCPVLLMGLLSLTRSGAAVRDRASMIDGLILTTGAGFLSLTFLINPYLLNADLTFVEKAISIAYPLYDVLILAILARLVIAVTRMWTVTLLLLSGAGLLAADVLYGLSQLNGTWQLGGPVDLGWILFYAAGGAAALHPSMVKLTEPRVRRQTEVHARRAVLGVASLVAPTVLLVEALRGPVRDGLVIAVVSALLVLLAIARMSVVASGLRRTLARERELRLACEALLSTADNGEVSEVVHNAVARLLPPGTAHRVVLAVLDPPATPAYLNPSDSAVSMCYTRTLPAEIAADLEGFELALQCRLSIGEHRVGDLFVAADEIALVALQQAVPVLAGQAATMLDHIKLNMEINRRDSEAYFRTLVLNAADVILIVDADNCIGYASPSALTMFGGADLTGASLLDLVDPEQRATTIATIEAVRAGECGGDPGDWTVRHANEERLRVEVSIRDLRDERTVGGLVLTMRDVTERRRLEQELIRRAYVDPLTGLGNRLHFHEAVQQSATRAARTGVTAGVLIINLDDFKIVNDTMGHDMGDELLVAVSRRLVETVQDGGAVARLGADEFGVVMDQARDLAEIEQLVEKVMAAFAVPFLVSHSAVTAQLSIGVATTADAADGHQLLSQADIALGTAKSTGKARWRRYETSLHLEVLERMQLRTELDQALADGAFKLAYQPIVDLHTGRTCGFEALARWEHPRRGTVPPLEFIQLAEESGLIVPLGAWVLRTAVTAAAGWLGLRPTDRSYISVNVSVRQFRTPGFVDQVLTELVRSGLPAECLVLEITESLLLADQEQIRADLTTLRQAGIGVSIDDFGTGYSSLSYLHQVPVDALKLDKSFVDTISTSSQQFDLVNGIVQMAGTLQLDVVAEGIETSEDLALLIEAGCRFGQGYLFARPMSHGDATEWVRANSPFAAQVTPVTA